MSKSELLTKSEVAALLGGEAHPVSISFVNQLIAKERLAKVRLSYKVCRIPRSSVEAFIAKRTLKAKQ